MILPYGVDTSRIAGVAATSILKSKYAAIVGLGGGAGLAKNLTRYDIGGLYLIDHDTVGVENICRQDHLTDQIGRPKVEALWKELRRIKMGLGGEPIARNFLSFTDAELDQLLSGVDLLIFCVDNLPANARGNEVALRLGIPAVWSGLYPNGTAGEVAFWYRGLKSCYHDLLAERYAAHERGEATTGPSEGADILAVQLLDSITGMVALGLLTRGADNFYGRLIDELGDRNFLQIRIKDWMWNGQDVIRDELQIPKDNDNYYSFCTIARRDPDNGEPPCPDCLRFGRREIAHLPPSVV